MIKFLAHKQILPKSRRSKLGLSVLLVLVAVLSIAAYSVLPVFKSAANAQSQTFTATGFTVSDPFLSYWNSHGGLAQQGYPISPLMYEYSTLDGKLHQVQYFERAVFEYHPENAGTQYDVLLAQLGTYAFKRKYPNGAPAASTQSLPGSGSQFFAQTNHTVSGIFLQYWNSHGGLAQQGYPISDVFAEKSDVDGQVRLVQYFERAEFEYHPDLAGTQYEVLLSLLGKIEYQNNYSDLQGQSITIRSGGNTNTTLQFNVSKVERRLSIPQPSEDLLSREGYNYVVVYGKLTNTGSSNGFVTTVDLGLADDAGNNYSLADDDVQTAAKTALGNSLGGTYTNLSAGQSTDAVFVFEVPASAHNLRLVPNPLN